MSSQDLQWYYVKNDEAVGPVSEQDMISLIQNKEITAKTYVWNSTLQDWIYLENSTLANVLNQAGKVSLNLTKTAVVPNEEFNWYYVENGESKGPFDTGYMIYLIKQRKLNGLSYVWNESFKEWVLLKDTSLVQYLSHPVSTTDIISAPLPESNFTNLQPRSIGIYLLLTIFTCGLFGWFWIYLIGISVNELAERNNVRPAINPGMAIILSLLTCGAFGIYYLWKLASVLAQIEINGHRVTNFSLLVILAAIFLQPVAYCILQDQVNELIGYEG